MMCGRITQIKTRMKYVEELGVEFDHVSWVGGDTIPQYNVYPDSHIRVLSRLYQGKVRDSSLKWGYCPEWAKQKGYGRVANAKIEKAATGRYFRQMWAKGRVLIPADGWFEWTGEKGHKQPWYIRLESDRPMFMAGIANYNPEVIQTVEVGAVIVTEQSDAGLVDIHGRRPVVFTPEDAQRWIDPDLSPADVISLAREASRPAGDFTWYKVSTAVNSAVPMYELTNQQAKSLIEPIDSQ